MTEVKFEGLELTITVADSSLSVNSFLNELRSSLPLDNTNIIGRPIVGLHIKYSSTANDDKVATLQLCYGSRCSIIQLLHLDSIPRSLKTFLADPEICFAGGFGINHHIAMLRRDYGLDCASVLDEVNLNQLLSRFDDESESDQLVEWESQFDVVSNLTPINLISSDWGARSLTLEQIKYACTTAYFLYLLGTCL